MKPIIFHYHIFKNAGTSFNHSLRKAFASAFLEYDPGQDGAAFSPREISDFISAHPEAKAVSSHQACLPVPKVPDRLVLTTMLIRDPIARIRSIYAFEKKQPGSGLGAIRAKELNFKAYVEWRLQATPNMLCNYQTHYCSRTQETFDEIPAEAEFQRACDQLEQLSAPGTVENYAHWLALVNHLMAPEFPGVELAVARRNVTREKPAANPAQLRSELIGELGSELVERLVESNQLDMRLHQFADALLDRKLAQQTPLSKLRELYQNPPLPTSAVNPTPVVAKSPFFSFLGRRIGRG